MKQQEHLIGAYGTAPYNTLPCGGSRLESTPLLITLSDGSMRSFAEALSCVMNYWRSHYFP